MKPFENIVGKGENGGNQHFLLFQQCFQLIQQHPSSFASHLFLSSANAFNLDWSLISLYDHVLINQLKHGIDWLFNIQKIDK